MFLNITIFDIISKRNDTQGVKRMKLEEIYEMFDEDKRLNKTQADTVEFITTTNFINKYLKEGDKILDIGAGTGAYSIHYAKKGYNITAVEPVKKNLVILKDKIDDKMKIEAKLGNALDLSNYQDNSFDLILCLGPLYHLHTKEEQLQCLNELKRVCKKDGVIFIAYISNDMVIVTESFRYNSNFLLSNHYDHESFKVKDNPFVFFTVEKFRELMQEASLEKVCEFGAEGLSELLHEEINKLSKEQFEKWVRYHQYICEKEQMLGYSNHIVYVAKNK